VEYNAHGIALQALNGSLFLKITEPTTRRWAIGSGASVASGEHCASRKIFLIGLAHEKHPICSTAGCIFPEIEMNVRIDDNLPS
jgi:hypothetical protein